MNNNNNNNNNNNKTLCYPKLGILCISCSNNLYYPSHISCDNNINYNLEFKNKRKYDVVDNSYCLNFSYWDNPNKKIIN